MANEDDLNSDRSEGYDVEFVDEHVSKQNLKCSICLLVLRKPMQAAPCGHRFCKPCIEAEKKRQETLLCPNDRLEIQIFPDIGKEKEILEFQVKCSNLKCHWTGELRNFEKHLQQCPFQVLECEKKCSQKNILRKEMSSHLENECPNNLIDCSFSSIGCQFKGKLKELEMHLETSTAQHLLIQNERIFSLEKDLSNEKDEHMKLKAKVTNLKRKNDYKITQLKRDMEKLSSFHRPKCPITFTIKNVSSEMKKKEETELESEVFEFLNGYRGRLLVLLHKQESDEDNKPIESNEKFIGVYLELVKGPFDDVLQWPMLFNEVCFKCFINGKCIRKSSFKHKEKLNEIFNQPISEIHGNSWGLPNFVNQSNIPDTLVDDIIKVVVDITKTQ